MSVVRMSPELSALIASVGKTKAKGGRGGRELKRTDWTLQQAEHS